MKKALITGITGQDGSYLAELLLEKGYDVYGIKRRASTVNTPRIDNIFNPELKDKIFYGDLQGGIEKVLLKVRPDEIYNLAAQSHVAVSFEVPEYTFEVNALSVFRMLESIKHMKDAGVLKDPKVYQASSSEMFGDTPPPQSEVTSMSPVSPYGIAKLAAFRAMRYYRQAYGLFACTGILFNHESPRRGENFVTKKITRAAARIRLGLQDKIHLGNLDAKRDWGHSKDYVRAIWMIMQHDVADEFVVSTGQTFTVREFGERVFKYLGLDFYNHLVQDDAFKRPSEVPALLGDSTKIRETLGWTPEYDIDALIKDMVDYDLKNEGRLIT